MTREEFQKIVNDLLGFEVYYPNEIYCSNPPERERKVLSVEWRTGGITGGSCWGGEANISIDADEEPEFEELFSILELVAPNLTFLHYRNLLKIVKQDDRTDREYYGNCSYYTIRRICLDDLYRFLKEHKYL